jgi:hypothetical protein
MDVKIKELPANYFDSLKNNMPSMPQAPKKEAKVEIKKEARLRRVDLAPRTFNSYTRAVAASKVAKSARSTGVLPSLLRLSHI